jgi:hypothetical protein
LNIVTKTTPGETEQEITDVVNYRRWTVPKQFIR